jgi:mono/diheme cytochrome c family protein
VVRRGINIGVVVLSLLALVATGTWLWFEHRWSRWSPPDGTAAETGYHSFTKGAFGLEVFPLKFAAVADKVAPAAFTTTLEDGRSVWETYGFLPNPKAGELKDPMCQGNAADWLPYGFAITNYLPLSAVQTPLKFAGLTCASCHSGHLRTADGKVTGPISGMGNMELDVIAFTDAVRNAVLDPNLTASRIQDAYAEACPDDDTGFLEGLVERLVLSAWLSGIQGSVGPETANYGLPYHGIQMKQAEFIPAGPGRTRPFRSIVRVAMNLPGEDNYAYSKIPVVFEQRPDLRPRAQYDGSLGDPVTRSFIAAYASGSSIKALSKPEVVQNIRSAAAYTEDLGIGIPIEPFAKHFPEHVPDAADVERGFGVYREHCAGCHGYRPVSADPAKVEPWVPKGDKLHQFEWVGPNAPAGSDLGVDIERVSFRYAHDLPLAIWTTLPGWQETVEEQERRLDRAIDDASAKGAPALAYFWNEQKDKLLLTKRQYRLGHPLYFPACPPGDASCQDKDLLSKAPPCSDHPHECELTDLEAYFNNPIPYAFLRAPYLHNASIPTMAQLINLEPRQAQFCRGANLYDPEALGYVTPAPVDGKCQDPRQAFLFDASVRGNGNHGHDYPWPANQVTEERKADLRALLAYLKTL